MKDELIYDAVTMSRTPFRAFCFAIGFGVIAFGVWVWNHSNDESAGPLFVFFLIAATLMSIVASLAELEKRMLANKQPLQVQGVVEGVWQDRQVKSIKRRDYVEWEGFKIRGVEFAYVRNTDQNYFNNAGTHRIDLVDGLRLRVHYLEKHKQNRVIRFIVRVERLH